MLSLFRIPVLVNLLSMFIVIAMLNILKSDNSETNDCSGKCEDIRRIFFQFLKLLQLIGVFDYYFLK